MIVVLGKHARPNPFNWLDHALGVTTRSSKTFLDLLRLQIGVQAADDQDATLAFSAALAKGCTDKDFFHSSFSIDSLGVAAHLLAAAEDLSINADLDFTWTSLADVPRVGSLARIAQSIVASDASNSSPSEVLRRVIRKLRRHPGRVGIARIRLMEPKESWPKLWRHLFSELESQGTEITLDQAPPVLRAPGDLCSAIASLDVLSRDKRPKAARDSSIERIHGTSTLEAADALASFIRSETILGHTVAIIRSAESSVLDDALHRQDLSMLGSTDIDRGQGPTELLPLLLTLLAHPLDPNVYLAFLNAEPNPLPKTLRRMLREQMNDHPAYVQRLAFDCVDRYAKNIDDSEREAKVQTWKRWLALPASVVDASVPSDTLAGMLDLLRSWAATSLKVSGKSESIVKAFGTLFGNCANLKAAIQDAPDKAISRPDLQRLAAHLCSNSSSVLSRECSPILGLDCPEELVRPVDTVVWWMGHDSVIPRPRPSLWTRSEREALAALGIELQDRNLRLDEAHTAAVNLLRNAKRRFIMVTVDRLGGEPVAPHPLWSEIEECFDPSSRPATKSVPAVWKELAATNPGSLTSTPRIVQHDFSPRWSASPSLLDLRDRESPSSLERLLGCSLSWTFHYAANLKDRAQYSTSDGILLLGKMTHACFEAFFKSGAHLEPAPMAETKARDIIKTVIAERAALLLMPGRERDRLEAEEKTAEGLLQLAKTMASGGWDFVAAEEDAETTDLPNNIKGRLDLLFRRKTNPSEKLIVDIKYVGKTKRTNELRRGNAVQLSAYSRMLRAGSSWPKTAYYIVHSQELLSVHGDLSSNLYPVNGEAEEDVWSRLEPLINTARLQLSQGHLDVGIDEEDSKALNESGRVVGAKCKYCEFDLFCAKDRRPA